KFLDTILEWSNHSELEAVTNRYGLLAFDGRLDQLIKRSVDRESKQLRVVSNFASLRHTRRKRTARQAQRKSSCQCTSAGDWLNIGLQRCHELISVILSPDNIVKAIVPERHYVVRHLFILSLFVSHIGQQGKHAVDVIVVKMTHH